MIHQKTFTKIIEKIKSLKNKKQILNFLYEYHFNEVNHNLELDAIKANNFGLIDGFDLLIGSQSLIDYDFVYIKNTNTFYINLPLFKDGSYNEYNRIDIRFNSKGFDICFTDLNNEETVPFANHNLKTIKDLSDLIFTLTKHRIKPNQL